jgi:hypothetical protein
MMIAMRESPGRSIMGVVSTAILVASFTISCSSSSTPTNGSPTGTTINGTLGGAPFVVADVLLIHPQHWKSADSGSIAVLVSDTPNLCAQITSGKTTAPGRMLGVVLEQRGADGAIVMPTPGTFMSKGQGTPSSRYGDVFGDSVDAKCAFNKFFTTSVQIGLSTVGAAGTSVGGTVSATLDSGDSLSGTFSAATTCDETAVDAWLNASPKCG